MNLLLPWVPSQGGVRDGIEQVLEMHMMYVRKDLFHGGRQSKRLLTRAPAEWGWGAGAGASPTGLE